MLLSYRDPRFWEKFRTQHWQPSVPTVLRQPFKDFPFPEASLFRALRVYAEAVRDGDHRKPCLVSVGDCEVPPRRPLRTLFRRESESLAQLEQTAAEVFSGRAFGLMITHMQAVDPGIWGPLSAFLQDASGWLDFPVPRAFLDLFYGNYASTFTGLHKDTQEILAFVVRGKKRMLAWPFDYFLSRVEGLKPADRFFNKRLPIDHRPYRKDALVLDARAGDLIYWPSDHWHVSEVQGGRFSAMLSLGLFRPDVVHPSEARSHLAEKLIARDPRTSPVVSQDLTADISGPDTAEQLRWITGFGFEIGGPQADGPTQFRTTPKERTVVKSPGSVILWTIDRARRRMLVSSNGHSIALAHSAALVKLLERISRGEPVRVAVGSARVRANRSAIGESTWDKHCVFKIRRRTTRGDLRVSLVDWLLRVYAVAVEKGEL